MEITNEYDIGTSGRKLTAGKGRRKLKAWILYAAGPDMYFLVGDINRRSYTAKPLERIFERFAQDPDAFDLGTPPTVAELCLPLPPGVPPEVMWEAPKCRGRKDRERVLAWNRSLHKRFGNGMKPWYKRVVGAA